MPLLNKTALASFWAPFENVRATFYSNIWSHCVTAKSKSNLVLPEDSLLHKVAVLFKYCPNVKIN